MKLTVRNCAFIAFATAFAGVFAWIAESAPPPATFAILVLFGWPMLGIAYNFGRLDSPSPAQASGSRKTESDHG